jgi:aminoglycoside 3-N-acetyltransferase
MKEADLIARTPTPATVDSLCRELRALGLQAGDTILVHASLSSLGWVCGGAQAVIQALLETLTVSGTLVMPAHSGDWSDPQEWEHPPVPAAWIPVIRDAMPAFDPDMTPTRGMGTIAELFRSLPGCMRSSHPQLSFSAVGPLSEEITRDHPLQPALGDESPLGRLYMADAKVLLLGVGYDVCTSFHLAEARLPGMPRIRMGTAWMRHGTRAWEWFEDCAWDSADFAAIGEAFEASQAPFEEQTQADHDAAPRNMDIPPVRIGTVGLATCRLFPIRAGVDFALAWLGQNRTG